MRNRSGAPPKQVPRLNEELEAYVQVAEEEKKEEEQLAMRARELNEARAATAPTEPNCEARKRGRPAMDAFEKAEWQRAKNRGRYQRKKEAAAKAKVKAAAAGKEWKSMRRYASNSWRAVALTTLQKYAAAW